MRVHRGLRWLPCEARGCSIAIGNFDGVHRGHRTVIAKARTLARDLGTETAVLTFEPHPREVIAPERAPLRLTSLRQKLGRLGALDVNHVFVLRFTTALMAMSASTFVDEVIGGALAARAVVTGDAFRFGNRRAGDTTLLAERARENGFVAAAVPPLRIAGEVCASSLIRTKLAQGAVADAAVLLGRPHEVEGMVRTGDRRGRTLGFPTANVHPLHPRAAVPPAGVYAVRAGVRAPAGTTWYDAVASLGTNPTFDGSEQRLEVHFLDGGRHSLYGRRLRVAFIAHLRGEERFPSAQALIDQMHRDCAAARAVHDLARSPSPGTDRTP